MTATADIAFQVDEMFTGQDDLLILSLGFASVEDPLDIIHIVCGRTQSGRTPPIVEDLLYIERSDQSLACDGHDIVSLVGYPDRLELFLSDQGARALDLPEHILFRFDRHPEFADRGNGILDAMASAGQAQVAVYRPTEDGRAKT